MSPVEQPIVIQRPGRAAYNQWTQLENVLAEGTVPTPVNRPAIDDPQPLEEKIQSIPWMPDAKPSEIARLPVFLASSDADDQTDTTVCVLALNLGRGA
jgi:glucose 1-dehydrogenase